MSSEPLLGLEQKPIRNFWQFRRFTNWQEPLYKFICVWIICWILVLVIGTPVAYFLPGGIEKIFFNVVLIASGISICLALIVYAIIKIY